MIKHFLLVIIGGSLVKRWWLVLAFCPKFLGGVGSSPQSHLKKLHCANIQIELGTHLDLQFLLLDLQRAPGCRVKSE